MKNLQIGDTYMVYKLQHFIAGNLLSDGYSNSSSMEIVNISMEFGFKHFPEIAGFLLTPIKRTRTPFGQDDIVEEQEPIIYRRNQD